MVSMVICTKDSIHLEYEYLIKMIGEENKDKIASNLVIEEIKFVMECLVSVGNHLSDDDKKYYLKKFISI